MFTVLCMCDCSKQLERSQPQADGGITSCMPNMTGVVGGLTGGNKAYERCLIIAKH